MKRIFTACCIFPCCIFFCSKTDAQTFNPGDNVFNLGVGLGGNLYTGTGYSTNLPPIGVAFDHGLNAPKWGIGGFIGVASATYQYNYSGYGYDSWKYTYKIIGVRGTYHFYMKDKFDVYGGALLGYDAVSVTFTGPYTDYRGMYTVGGSGLAFDIFVGGRYYFSPKVGVVAELGYGISFLTIGVTFKL